VERLDRHACSRDCVVHEVDLSADLMASEEFVGLTEPLSQFVQGRMGGRGAATIELLTRLIEQTPDTCGGVDGDAKVLHVFLRSGRCSRAMPQPEIDLVARPTSSMLASP